MYCHNLFQMKSLLQCQCVHNDIFTEEISLVHCKYESQNHYTMWTYSPNIFVHIHGIPLSAISISHLTVMYYLKCHKLAHVQIGENSFSIHTSYGLTVINNVPWNIGIHTFHITGIYPLRNIPYL